MSVQRVGTCDGCKGQAGGPAPCCQFMELHFKWLVSDAEESDFLRWLLSHEGVSCDAEGYNVKVASRCRWLTPEGDCSIYENRPELCKEWPYDSGCLERIPDCGYRFVEGAEAS